jgi:hypothetical protein
MVLQRHQGIGEDRQADGRRVQQRGVACDVSGALQAAQPPPARRRGQADALGEFLVGDARIGLQLFEDAPVQPVEGLGHGRDFP